jgi:hypothetical protein
MAQQGNVWLETQLSGATARSYIIFWSLGRPDAATMWPGQWQYQLERLGLTNSMHDLGQLVLLSSWVPVSPSGGRELFLRPSLLQRKNKKNGTFLLGEGNTFFAHWAFTFLGWRRTMRLQKASAFLAVLSTCITWISVRRMTPNPSTPPALGRWVHLHQADTAPNPTKSVPPSTIFK